jgi:phosphohistidine phosphatase
MKDNNDNELKTTNAEDQAAVAALRQRLERVNANHVSSSAASVHHNHVVPKVQIANGAHKYVLVEAANNNKAKEYFVISKRGASYHQNAAEPLVHQLEQSNHYHAIRVTGGGRIALDESQQTIRVFGFSYGFGLADHQITKQVIQSDPRYQDYEITWSNDGY